MSEDASKKLEQTNRSDGDQDSNTPHSNSTPNLKRKRSDTHLNELITNKSDSEVKRRKKRPTLTSFPASPSCSKEDSCSPSQNHSGDLKKFLQEELTCSICSEMFIDAVTLNCSHSFCKLCILKWMIEQSTCPVCRKEISSQNSSLVLNRFVEKIVELSPEETQSHRKSLIEARENQKDISVVPPVPEQADPDTEQLINDFLCWFGISEFMEIFDVRNQDDDPIHYYNHNDNCTIN